MKEENKNKLGHAHPTGLWYLSFCIIFVTLAFGTVNSLLVLYLTKRLNFTEDHAYQLFAAFNCLVFTLPIVAGYLGQKLGYKPALFMGLAISFLGTGALFFTGSFFLYSGLALLALGSATNLTVASCIIGLLYDQHDKRRESGFTIFYLIFNIGFFVASVMGGYISRYFNYHVAFGLAALGMIVSMASFLWCQHRIHPYPGRTFLLEKPKSKSFIYATLLLSNIGIVIISVLLLLKPGLASFALWALVILVSAGIIYLGMRQPCALARKKVFAFLILCIISIGFWSLYMLEPSVLTLFIDKNVNRHIFNTIIPPSAFWGLDPLYIFIFGALFGWLWHFLQRHNRDLSLPTKFTASLFSMGLGYWVVAIGIFFVGEQHLVNMSWVVIGYLFLTVAELLISPIGLSMVGRLSPHGKEGVFMGVWQLFIGFSAILSGSLAKLAIVPKNGLPAQTNAIYQGALFHLGLMTIGVAVIAGLLIPQIKRLVNASSSMSDKEKSTL